MSNKKIYTRRSLQYQEKIKIMRDVLQLVGCIAAILAFNWAMEWLARMIV